MSRSDIFDDYIKIMEETGIVAKAADEESSAPDKPKDSPKMKKYKKSPHPRMGSDDISTIEALYGVKPDSSIEYEDCIMEAAHPKPVVIAPSYDRLNGLVENNIERHNIMCNIALKPTDGKLTQHRYAEKELLLELVKVANFMDATNNEDLRSIADSCIEKLASEKKKLSKQADWSDWLKEKSNDLLETGKGAGVGGMIGGIAGGLLGGIFGEGVGAIPAAKVGILAGGAIGGIISSLTKTSPQVRNISWNAKDLISQINDLKGKIDSEKANNIESQFLSQFILNLQVLITCSNQYNQVVSELDMHHLSSANDAKNAAQASSQLVLAIENTKRYAQGFGSRVERGVYKEYVGHSKLTSVFYNFIDDDVEDVQKSMVSLLGAITQFEKGMQQVKEESQQAISSADTEKALDLSPKAPAANPASGPNEETSAKIAPPEDMDKLFDFVGYKPNDDEKGFWGNILK